jgi:hypothetical protein
MKNKNVIIAAIISIIVIAGALIYTTKVKNSESMKMNMTTQSHRSYAFNLISSENDIKPKVETVIKYSIKDDTGATVKNFALDHTKLMHFIIVRSDLQDFQHLHPEFNKSTGDFTIPVTFPNDGVYRLFADFTPSGGQKDSAGNYLPVTLPMDVNVGNISLYQKRPVTVDTQMTKSLGDYKFTYSIPSPLNAGVPIKLVINVTKNGQPVTNMEEYLGAQAHGILLKDETLDFAHLHAMGGETMTHTMGGKTMTMQGPGSQGPDVDFDYTFPSAGIYKLFTQFQHEGKVITIDYTLGVE